MASFCAVLFPTRCLRWDLGLNWVSFWGISYLLLQYYVHFGMRIRKKNRIYSKQVLHLTSTPPLSKIRSAGILSIWQKEITSSHIWTAIKFEYFDLTKIRFLEFPDFPWFSAKFQISWFFPAGNFISPFSLFYRVRGHPVLSARHNKCLHDGQAPVEVSYAVRRQLWNHNTTKKLI